MFIRDGCAVNTTAANMITLMCPNIFDLICMAHSASLCGELLDVPLASVFVSLWSQMMTTSNKARAKFRDSAGVKPKTKSKVRWGTEQQVAVNVMLNWPLANEIIADDDSFADGLRSKMLPMISPTVAVGEELSPKQLLELELALYSDLGQSLYDFIYNYEGDEFYGHLIYDAQTKVRLQLSLIVNDHTSCPNVIGLLSSYRLVDEIANAELAKICNKGIPVLAKWDSIFTNPGGKLFSTMQLFKGFRLLSPCNLREVGVKGAYEYIDLFLECPRLKARKKDLKAQLVAELPRYFNSAAHVSSDVNILEWWRDKKSSLKTWYEVVGEAVLFQVTSATAERSFSLLDSLFDSESAGALEDLKEGSVMCRVNDLQRLREKMEYECITLGNMY